MIVRQTFNMDRVAAWAKGKYKNIETWALQISDDAVSPNNSLDEDLRDLICRSSKSSASSTLMSLPNIYLVLSGCKC